VEIDLDEQFIIKTDENNFMLCEKKKRGKDSKKEGEEYHSTLGYYGDLKYTLRAYIKHSLRRNEAKANIKGLEVLLEELNQTIKGIK